MTEGTDERALIEVLLSKNMLKYSKKPFCMSNYSMRVKSLLIKNK